MTCTTCKGDGCVDYRDYATGQASGPQPCAACNGAGRLCDYCGMPISSDEPATHIHRECLAILRADRRRDEEKDETQ